MSRARILLADDNASILARVASLLSTDFDVVATVGDGQAALDAIERLKPDLAVFDVSMPAMSGFEAAAALAGIDRPPRVVFLTVHEDQEFVDAAAGQGVVVATGRFRQHMLVSLTNDGPVTLILDSRREP